jgi:hypothetical membrane protein
MSINKPSKDDLYTRDVKTKVLLVCGAIAGPLFTLAWIVEGATRANYNPLRHPISSLSISDAGWTQVTTFIVTGLLMLAFAFGLRRVPQIRAGSTWGPLLIGAMWIGLLGAGFFVTDPMNGYPPGTPDLLLQYSLSGRLHRLFSALFFLGLPGACFVFARLFAKWGQRRWSIYLLVTGIAFLVMFIVTSAGFAQVDGLANYAGLLQRITLTIGWVWQTLLPIFLLNLLNTPEK